MIEWFRSLGNGTSESYLPSPLDKELSTVITYDYSDQKHPWLPGSRLRLLLTTDHLLFVQQSVLAGPFIRLRIACSDLLAVRLGYFPLDDDTDSVGEFLVNWVLFGDVEARQIERHNQLVRSVSGPRRAEGLLIEYRDKLRYDGRSIFVGVQLPRESGVSLRETAYYLRRLIQGCGTFG